MPNRAYVCASSWLGAAIKVFTIGLCHEIATVATVWAVSFFVFERQISLQIFSQFGKFRTTIWKYRYTCTAICSSSSPDKIFAVALEDQPSKGSHPLLKNEQPHGPRNYARNPRLQYRPRILKYNRPCCSPLQPSAHVLGYENHLPSLTPPSLENNLVHDREVPPYVTRQTD